MAASRGALPKLPRLRGLAARAAALATREGGAVRAPTVQEESSPEHPQGAPPPEPFASWWEVWLDGWLRRRDPGWEPQVQFGRLGAAGSTRPDWVHEVLRIALYLDGIYWHREPQAAREAYRRAQVASAGYRVVAWTVYSLEQLKEGVSEWYQRDIGGS